MERRKTDSNSSIGTIAFIATICFFILSAVPTIAQDKSGVPKKLIVGTVILPPFVMKGPSGAWEGLSIELLQAVTLDLGIDYELREYNTDYLKDAVVNEDGTPFLTVNYVMERAMQHESQPHQTHGNEKTQESQTSLQ